MLRASTTSLHLRRRRLQVDTSQPRKVRRARPRQRLVEGYRGCILDDTDTQRPTDDEMTCCALLTTRHMSRRGISICTNVITVRRAVLCHGGARSGPCALSQTSIPENMGGHGLRSLLLVETHDPSAVCQDHDVHRLQSWYPWQSPRRSRA